MQADNAATKQRSPTREEVGEMAKLAKNLANAHLRRSASSENATLAEEAAIFELRWQLNELGKRCSGGR